MVGHVLLCCCAIFTREDAAEFCCFWLSVTTQHIEQRATQQQQKQKQKQKPTMSQPNRPDCPAFTSQRAYPHLTLLRSAVAAVILVAHLFRPSNSGVQEHVKKERVKKGDFLYTRYYSIGLLH